MLKCGIKLKVGRISLPYFILRGIKISTNGFTVVSFNYLNINLILNI